MRNTVLLFLVRGLGVGVSALGGIWVARTLGPEKLGISTFVFAMVGLVGVLSSLNQNYRFVRDGKNLPAGESLEDLVGQVFSLRLGLVLMLLAGAFVGVLVWRPESTWIVAIAAGGVMALVQSNDAGWLLQLRKQMPRLFVAMSIQAMVTGLLCLALIRPGWPAGSDLAMAAVGSAVGAGLAWWWACRGGLRIRVSLDRFLKAFRLLRGGLWLALMGLGLYVVGTLEVPLIAALASVEDLGVYRTAMQFINVINPFLPLFFHHLYPQLVELERDNPLGVLGAQFRALGRVAAFGVPLTAAAFVLAPWVYPLVFGEKFAAAAYPFATLFAAKVLSVGVNVFMWGALARKLDRAAVLLTLSVSVVSILLNVMLIPVLGIIGAAVVNCLAQSLLLAGYVALMARSTSKLRLKLVP